MHCENGELFRRDRYTHQPRLWVGIASIMAPRSGRDEGGQEEKSGGHS